MCITIYFFSGCDHCHVHIYIHNLRNVQSCKSQWKPQVIVLWPKGLEEKTQNNFTLWSECIYHLYWTSTLMSKYWMTTLWFVVKHKAPLSWLFLYCNLKSMYSKHFSNAGIRFLENATLDRSALEKVNTLWINWGTVNMADEVSYLYLAT